MADKFPQSYHLVWLQSHQDRSMEWLRSRLSDGFHIHHVDGDHSNDAPLNLILIEGTDHTRLHAGSLAAGIENWRRKSRAASIGSDEIAAPIYAAKAADPRGWKEFAQDFHGGVKPVQRVWSDIAMRLQNRARNYAKRNALPWPPAIT